MSLFSRHRNETPAMGSDPRALNVKASNAYVGGVYGLDLGGGFSAANVGSGLRVGGGVLPAVTEIAVPRGSLCPVVRTWSPFAADWSTNPWGLDREGPLLEHYIDDVSGGITDSMGLGAVGPRSAGVDSRGGPLGREIGGLERPPDRSRAFGGLLERVMHGPQEA